MGTTQNKRITVIQGHPDGSGNRFGHALARAYMEASRESGHDVRVIEVANLAFPLLHTKEDFERGDSPEALSQAREDILWASHIAIFFPLWLGTMPAVLHAFFEQIFRPNGASFKDILKGKTARLVVTMGMPSLIYRWYFRAHGIRGLEKSILRFCGMGSIRESLIGMIENPNPAKRKKWLEKMQQYGREGS